MDSGMFQLGRTPLDFKMLIQWNAFSGFQTDTLTGFQTQASDDHVLEVLHLCSVWISADDLIGIGAAAQKESMGWDRFVTPTW